jgi:hypothetical protein
MAAGQGFKTFVTGEVLTSGDVNGYLMQGINVFASTAARDAAITAPAEGQFAFTKDTNSLWYYDGAAWVASGATGDIEGVTAGIGISGGGTSGTVTVTNSMATAIDAKGDLVPGTGADTFARLAVGANDTILTADSTAATGMKWAAASVSVSKSSINEILNGDFFINQREFTSNTTDGSYNFDRFLQKNSGGTTTVTPQVFAGGEPIAGAEGVNFLQSITASHSAAGDFAYISQRIENVRTLAGGNIVISFYAKANTGTPKVGVQIVQNFGTGGSPSAEVSTPISAVTLTTSWTRYQVTVAAPSLSGKTFGTTANTSYVALNLWQSAGSTFATQASSIGIQNYTLSLWGIQVEAGTSATSFQTATGTQAGELLACQRYFYNMKQNFMMVGQAKATNNARGMGKLPVTMRVEPTLTLGAWRIYYATSDTDASVSATTETAAKDSIWIQQTTSSVLTAGQAIFFINYSSTLNTANAEL